MNYGAHVLCCGAWNTAQESRKFTLRYSVHAWRYNIEAALQKQQKESPTQLTPQKRSHFLGEYVMFCVSPVLPPIVDNTALVKDYT